MRQVQSVDYHQAPDNTTQEFTQDEFNDESIVEDNKGKFITTYEYSDNDGAINSHLEHSGTFDNLTHIKISNH